MSLSVAEMFNFLLFSIVGITFIVSDEIEIELVLSGKAMEVLKGSEVESLKISLVGLSDE